MTDWRSVKQWCHQGEGDRFGLCFWAMCGNWYVANGGAVMGDGEVENAAREMEGFDPYIAATDHGQNLEAGLDWIMKYGWPGDPTLKPANWRAVTVAELPATIEANGCAMAWCVLPLDADGQPYDFSDDAVQRGAEGVYAHAVLVVEATPETVTFITWAAPQIVSAAWWMRYGRGQYAVGRPASYQTNSTIGVA